MINLGSRSEYIKTICKYETDEIIRVSIEHFAIPIICGLSADDLTQKDFEKMGGVGRKPAPLSEETKLEIYSRIRKFIREKILSKTAELVNSLIDQAFASIPDADLRLKVLFLADKEIEKKPRWEMLYPMFGNHLILFNELAEKSYFKAQLELLHDALCPIMTGYVDSGEMFDEIKVDELLP